MHRGMLTPLESLLSGLKYTKTRVGSYYIVVDGVKTWYLSPRGEERTYVKHCFDDRSGVYTLQDLKEWIKGGLK